MRILFLDLDTLRPDHLGCYGYHRNTSPNIDRIAREGVRFDEYYCSDAPCLPSRAALFSGRHGIHTGVMGHGGTAGDMRIEGATRGFRDRMDHEGLVNLFRRQNMHTCTVSPFGERHTAWWFYAGFKEMHNPGKGGMESADEVTPTVLDWLKTHAKEDDWFLHINYWDPHTIYRAPKDFGNPFADEPLPAWLTPEVLEQHQKTVGPHSALDNNMYTGEDIPQFPRHVGEIRTMDDLRRHFDGYDCGIAYMDEHIGRIFGALEAAGVMEETAIVITSDHGENHGELGVYAEHGTSDYITHRVPMIVRWPGAKQGHVDSGLHYNLDLGPTLAELFGVDAPEAWDGQSYAPALTQGADCGRDFLVLSQCCHVCQRSVRFGPYQYIRTYHDFYHLFPQEMLFNVHEDPHEQHDLAPSRPELCQEGAHKLLAWHDDMMMGMCERYTVDPLWTVLHEGGPTHARGALKKYCERLEATGRGDAIEALKQRHPREFR